MARLLQQHSQSRDLHHILAGIQAGIQTDVVRRSTRTSLTVDLNSLASNKEDT